MSNAALLAALVLLLHHATWSHATIDKRRVYYSSEEAQQLFSQKSKQLKESYLTYKITVELENIAGDHISIDGGSQLALVAAIEDAIKLEHNEVQGTITEGAEYVGFDASTTTTFQKRNLQATTLDDQMKTAKPGDVIEFSGQITGIFQTYTDGTELEPITVRGLGQYSRIGGASASICLHVKHSFYIFDAKLRY